MMEQNNRYRRTDSSDEVIDLEKLFYYLLQGVKRFWAAAIALIVLLGLGGYVYAKVTYVPRYKASASVIVTDSMSIGQTSSELTLAAQMGKTFSYIIKSDMLRSVVEQQLGTEMLESVIDAQVVQDTNLLTISVSDPDPQHAYDVLNAVLENYPEISDYILGATKIEVVQEPKVPTQPFNSSNAVKNALLCGLAGVLLWLLLLVCYAFTRKTVSSADDVQNKINVALLANVPRVSVKKRSRQKDKKILVTQNNVSLGFEEAFRKIANRVERETEQSQGQKKVYVVTSSMVSEGKTTIATNLALTLAKRGKKVLLIDADLRRTASTNTLKMEDSENNLETFLLRRNTWDKSVHRYNDTSLYILPAGRTLDSAAVARLLSKNNIMLILDKARKEYDYIIVDTPPMGVLADAANVISAGDEVIVTVRQDQSLIRDVVETFEQIQERKTKLLGFVMNQAQGGLEGYGNYSYGAYGSTGGLK